MHTESYAEHIRDLGKPEGTATILTKAQMAKAYADLLERCYVEELNKVNHKGRYKCNPTK